MQKLVDALLGQRKTKEYQVGSSKMVMQTITAGEQNEISQRVGSRGLDYLSHGEALKVPTLARAIVSINNIPIDTFPEVRERLREDPAITPMQAIEQALSGLDWSIVEYFFTQCYADLISERAKELDQLKNSSGDQSAESSGKSAQGLAQPPAA